MPFLAPYWLSFSNKLNGLNFLPLRPMGSPFLKSIVIIVSLSGASFGLFEIPKTFSGGLFQGFSKTLPSADLCKTLASTL